ncbi:DUF2827 family protein [[Limnothrix rosea] IAM M-220]|uniref:DUF2827 family protein n=1 Tax=[Limnothrix rosea] IAM M-220 TaxID=454133 RepID=UPI00096868FE|nr:DUF2827 family protein [[Limnothrix rosea] IAM M-220]OKH19073.1 hypothetical protein NIES208_03645 [[Limnothrix rosea] IAM M-220]
MNKIKIGFVVSKYQGLNTKFNSGLEQNTYYLVSLLRSIPEYEVSYVLVSDSCLDESIQNQNQLNDDTPLVELKALDPKLNNPVQYDVLIHAESYLPENFIKAIKERFSTKFVNLLVGIVMWGLMEDIIYNIKDRYVGALPMYAPGIIDEQWINPQHAYHKEYVETLTKSNVAILPYIYEPWFLQKLENLRKKNNPDFDPQYSPESDKHIGILEANINLVKNAVIPVSIVESLYSQDKKALKRKTVRIYCSNNLRERQAFQHLFNYFEGKSLFTSEARFAVPDILHFDCDFIVSHQHLCSLNYLYLDALYYNIPLIHNSDTLKEYGYYYPNFDVKKGAEALKEALENHDSRLEEYAKQAAKALNKFSVSNKRNINGYKKIINKLIA